MIKYEPQRDMFYSDEQYEDAQWHWQYDPLYGWCRKNTKPDGTNYNLYRDGLRIYTTLNSKMQGYAEEAVAEHLSSRSAAAFQQKSQTKPEPAIFK